MMTMSVSEARAALPRVLDRVENGDQVTITRHGRPAAVVVRPDRVPPSRTADMEARSAEIRERLEQAKSAPIDWSLWDKPSSLTPEQVEEWVAEIRADRDSR